ncbi:GGDEF domain-containing protein [Thiohalorhabdus sp.]|uniref:GGDEF domain-containing protein n=1 Tax=Thiohalorhabdus sp. TaxID=3094134 RepID=UPI002FC399D5
MPLAVVYLDLDDFKAVNDRLGHEAGDAILGELGRLLAENTREEDVAARYGGEEFTLVLPFTGREGARAKAEELRALVADHPFPAGSGSVAAQLTVSAGVAYLEEEEEAEARADMEALAESLLRAADDHLYAAKAAGKNRVPAGS